MLYLKLLLFGLRSLLVPSAALRLENLALRQQLAVMKQQSKRSRLRNRDRFFWVLLSRLWSGWQSALILVKPDTVVRWHRRGFKLYWRWRSRKKQGRPTIDPDLIRLIKRMSRENPLWGAVVQRIWKRLATCLIN